MERTCSRRLAIALVLTGVVLLVLVLSRKNMWARLCFSCDVPLPDFQILANYQQEILAIAQWWNANPDAPRGMSCAAGQIGIAPALIQEHICDGLDVPPPLFTARTPLAPVLQRTRIALTIAFVDFQLLHLRYMIERWEKMPPCDPEVDDEFAAQVDLIFLCMGTNCTIKTRKKVESFMNELGSLKACFKGGTHKFLVVDAKEKMKKIAGSAVMFWEQFIRFEQEYQLFMQMEPDVNVIRPRWIPALVKATVGVGCEAGLWQLGSAPLGHLHPGDLRERLDLHLNGNGVYILGCPGYEDYKCRMQAFYRPLGTCSENAGCHTGEVYEDGYDHALYRFRMHPANYIYARSILNRFAVHPVIHNLGERDYDLVRYAEENSETYFVHSKAVFLTKAENSLRQIFFALELDPNDWRFNSLAVEVYTGLRTGELNQNTAMQKVCTDLSSPSLLSIIGPEVSVGHACSRALQPVEVLWKNRLPGKKYLWTADFHAGPINCDIPILTEAGAGVHAEVDFPNCGYFGLCKDRLKVLSFDDWRGFDPSENLKRSFYEAYKDDPEFARVDAFICHHPAANCELFLPFNKPLIIHATTRLEFGRHDGGIAWRINTYDEAVAKKKWRTWVETLIRLSENKKNVIAANNYFDAEYIHYFTGIRPMVLRSWCGEMTRPCEFQTEKPRCPGSTLYAKYDGSLDEVLIVPYRSNLEQSRFLQTIEHRRAPKAHPLYKNLMQVLERMDVEAPLRKMKLISDMYPNADPTNFVAHKAVVIIPYQVSTIGLFEIYRMAIPMFAPSMSLLKQWCMDYEIMWETIYGWPERFDDLAGGPTTVPNPNGPKPSEFFTAPDSAAFRKKGVRLPVERPIQGEQFDYWMKFADFYTFPHVITFDSWEDLNTKLATTDFRRVSTEMEAHNKRERQELVEQWRQIFRNL